MQVISALDFGLRLTGFLIVLRHVFVVFLLLVTALIGKSSMIFSINDFCIIRHTLTVDVIVARL